MTVVFRGGKGCFCADIYSLAQVAEQQAVATQAAASLVASRLLTRFHHPGRFRAEGQIIYTETERPQGQTDGDRGQQRLDGAEGASSGGRAENMKPSLIHPHG